MGIVTRDRYRRQAWRRNRAVSARLWLAVGMVVALGAALSVPVAHTSAASDTGLRHEGWQAWLADERACPGGGSTSAPPRAQVQSMLCLVNYARTRQDLRPLTPASVLNASAAAKAADIARCHDFTHDPCGEEASQTARDLGYDGPWSENLYIGNGRLASPRAAVDAWLDSPGHRANLFRPQLRTIGMALLDGVTAGRNGRRVSDGVIWVHQFGV